MAAGLTSWPTPSAATCTAGVTTDTARCQNVESTSINNTSHKIMRFFFNYAWLLNLPVYQNFTFCFQLGNGTTNQCLTPTLVQGALLGKVIVDAACGSHHSVVLTNEGELYAWGQVHSEAVTCTFFPNKIDSFWIKLVSLNVRMSTIYYNELSQEATKMLLKWKLFPLYM